MIRGDYVPPEERESPSFTVGRMSTARLSFVVYLCRVVAGEAQSVANQQVAWVWPHDLHRYPFPAATARMIQALREHLGQA